MQRKKNSMHKMHDQHSNKKLIFLKAMREHSDKTATLICIVKKYMRVLIYILKQCSKAKISSMFMSNNNSVARGKNTATVMY